MKPDIQELKAKALAAKERYSGKWQYLGLAGKLSDENYEPIADIRGWGYLTGKGTGGLGLSETEAIQVQRNMLAYIAAASPDTLLALIEIAEAAEVLVDRDIDYVGPQVRMKFDTHSEAFSAVLRLRTALEGVKK